MRCKPRSVAALQVALGGLPDSMHVEADKDLGVSAPVLVHLLRADLEDETDALHVDSSGQPGGRARVDRRTTSSG